MSERSRFSYATGKSFLPFINALAEINSRKYLESIKPKRKPPSILYLPQEYDTPQRKREHALHKRLRLELYRDSLEHSLAHTPATISQEGRNESMNAELLQVKAELEVSEQSQNGVVNPQVSSNGVPKTIII